MKRIKLQPQQHTVLLNDFELNILHAALRVFISYVSKAENSLAADLNWPDPQNVLHIFEEIHSLDVSKLRDSVRQLTGDIYNEFSK